MALHERLDYAGFSYLAVAHEDDFGRFDLRFFAMDSEIRLVGYSVASTISLLVH